MSIKEELKNLEQEGKSIITEKINDAFDMNYDVSQIRIETLDDFNNHLFRPFEQGTEIYYRGERINSKQRKLLPTFLRNSEILSMYNNNAVTTLDTEFVMNFYNKKSQFISVYETIYNDYEQRNLYNMLAFAQHYLDLSPFIDFTKSLYVALSFAIKGREDINDDIVIYTAFDIDFDDTSSDINEVNFWLENYNVNLVNLEYIDKTITSSIKSSYGIFKQNERKIKRGVLSNLAQSVSPVAKLIDIPTNDLMKYQQGVFLFLNDFSLIDSSYLTKTVRQSFVINKYIISSSLIPEIKKILLNNAPQYQYKYLMNISRAVKG